MSSGDEIDEDREVRRKGSEDILRASLQGLAIDAESQLAIDPEWIDRVDELALTFDDAFELAKIHCAESIDAAQWDAIFAIDRKLNAMSLHGTEFDPVIWTEDGLRTHPAWEAVRVLARRTLELLGWPCESPRRFDD
jgi:hypothetical protein